MLKIMAEQGSNMAQEAETSQLFQPTKLTNRVSKMISDVILGQVVEQLNHTLSLIAHDYHLPLEELKEKYGNPIPLTPKNEVKKEAKKRGRKKKQREEVIETEEYEYNDVVYLVDKDNNVYTHDVNRPVLVGTKLVDGRIKYLQE
jgi:LysM repeat protein